MMGGREMVILCMWSWLRLAYAGGGVKAAGLQSQSVVNKNTLTIQLYEVYFWGNEDFCPIAVFMSGGALFTSGRSLEESLAVPTAASVQPIFLIVCACTHQMDR